MIAPVTEDNLMQAAAVHAAAWQASHASFCTPEFVALHTPKRQASYLRRKLDAGSALFLLSDPDPIGTVSVTGNLIEDLYVLPERQNRGFGTALLRFAVEQCSGTPSLWILENNLRAKALYERLGFRETGNRKIAKNGLDEIELALAEQTMETARLRIDCIRETDKADCSLDVSADTSSTASQVKLAATWHARHDTASLSDLYGNETAPSMRLSLTISIVINSLKRMQ